MSSGEHSHHADHMTRIVKEFRRERGEVEYIEFICLVDGVTYQRIEIAPKEH